MQEPPQRRRGRRRPWGEVLLIMLLVLLSVAELADAKKVRLQLHAAR
jgi:hypothetical protein